LRRIGMLINMKGSARKTKATTQKFIEILDIIDDVVLFTSNNACSVIKVQALNFALLSEAEQNSRVLAYSSLLNSLSFSIQIFIRSKKIDISSYVNLLEQEMEKTQNQLLKNQIKLYKNFIQSLVKTNVVLDKEFYIIVPYTKLEGGIGATDKKNFLLSAKSKLSTKLESLQAMLRRMNLTARTLNEKELVKLFHEIYNEDAGKTSDVSRSFEYQSPTTVALENKEAK